MYAIIIICVNDKMLMFIKCGHIVSYYFFYRVKHFFIILYLRNECQCVILSA